MSRWLLLFVVLVGLGACRPSPGPALVEVTGVTNRELREGDTLELRGQSFPEGRVVTVTLTGDVQRPGEHPLNRFELSLKGLSASSHRVTVTVTRETLRAVTGGANGAHATFHGALGVSFRPRVSGTPPVTGQLSEVVLDFIPAEEEESVAVARTETGRRFAEYAGLLLREGDDFDTVSGVMPDSPAERAGVLAGDRMLELGGVRVLELSDLVPAPLARTADLRVERAGKRVVLPLDVTGFSPITPRELAPTAGAIGAVLLLLLLLASPFGRALSHLEGRLVERARGPAGVTLRRPTRPHGSLGQRLVGALPTRVGPYVALVSACALVMAVGLGLPLVAPEVDTLLLLVAAYASLAMAVLVFGVASGEGLVARLRRVLLVLVQGSVVGLALGAAVLRAGGAGTDELLLTQGPWPWEWLVARAPVPLFSALVLLVALVPDPALGRRPLGATAAEPARGLSVVPRLLARVTLIVVTGLAAIAWFGGMRASEASNLLAPLGALLLLLKTLSLAGLVLALRRFAGRLDLDEARGPLLFWLLPASLGLGALSWLGRRTALDAGLDGAARAAAAVCLAGGVALLVALVVRAHLGARRRPPAPGLNPWI